MYEKQDGTEWCNMETGEKIDGDMYRKKPSNKPASVELKGMIFMKLSIEGARKMLERLTPTEITMAIGLIPYVSYFDCCIRVGGKGEVMSAQDIAKELGMDDAKVYRLIKSLEEKGVMGHHATGSILSGYEGKIRKVYTVNPFIYCRGKKVNRSVYDFYLKSGWRDGT